MANIATITDRVKVRFWAKVIKSDLCWEWSAALNEAGYGMLGLGGRRDGIIRAHRLSWQIHFGEIAKGLFVCHRCDNRKCVRPDHLFLGTNDDNVADMFSKGRQSTPPVHHGIANPRARIIEWRGERRTLGAWAEITGIKRETIARRLKVGWSLDRALTERVAA